MNAKQVEVANTLLRAIEEQQEALKSGKYPNENSGLSCSIAAPDGVGNIIIGRTGQDALYELVDAAIKANGLSERITTSKTASLLGPIFLKELGPGQRITQPSQVQLCFSKANKEMHKALTNRRHLIPCHLINSNEMSQITLGPVTFYNCSAFRKLLLDSLPDRKDGKWKRVDREMIARAVRFYRGYFWVACIAVRDCEQDVGARYARKTTELAISALQLPLGARAAQKMRIANANSAVE